MLTALLAFSLAHAEENPVVEGAAAKVQVETTKPGVTVTVLYDESTSTVSTSYGTGSVYNFKKTEVCQAPCEFEVVPGMRGVLFSGQGYTPAGGRYDLREGTSTFSVKPGSKGLLTGGYYAMLIGLTAATVGGTMWGIESISAGPRDTVDAWIPATTVAGGVLLVAGIPMMVFSKTKVEFAMAQ